VLGVYCDSIDEPEPKSPLQVHLQARSGYSG